MSCQNCKSKDFIPLLQKADLKLIKCQACGLVQVDGLNEKFDIKQYDYYKKRVNAGQSELYNSITTKRYVSLLKRLERYRQNNALLDIGCGEGQFISVAKSMNWRALGVEIAPYAIEICNKFNLEVISGDLLELELKSGYYDIATMFEVLEHLTRPREYLFKINSVLRNGGILVFTTPNFNCLTRRLLQNEWSFIYQEHLFYYTPRLIKKLINDSGFKIIEFKIKNITLPELWGFFMHRNSDKAYIYNQGLRETSERHVVLSGLKSIINSFLNITQWGETIECICQKA